MHHSNQQKSFFHVPKEPQPNAPYPNRQLPDPVNARMKDSLSSPDSSGTSSPSWEAPSPESMSEHSTVNFVTGEIGSADHEMSGQDNQAGPHQEEISEVRNQSNKKSEEKYLADIIGDLPRFDDFERNMHEAVEIDQKQRTLEPPMKPTARITDNDQTDDEVVAFRDCIDQAESVIYTRPDRFEKASAERGVSEIMKTRRNSRRPTSIKKNKMDQSRAYVHESVQACIQSEAGQLSLAERKEAKKFLDYRIPHARKEVRRRQDHRISEGYLGKLIPTFLLNAIRPSSKGDETTERAVEKIEKAVVLAAGVVWIILLVRLVSTLQSEIQRLHSQNDILLERLSQKDASKGPGIHGNYVTGVFSDPRSSIPRFPPSISHSPLVDEETSYNNNATKGLKRHYAK